MAGKELRILGTAGQTVYCVITDEAAQYWDETTDQAFEAYLEGSFATYEVPLVEDGNSGQYFGDFPVAITTPGRYSLAYRNRGGGAAAIGDTKLTASALSWDGTKQVTFEDITGGGGGGHFPM